MYNNTWARRMPNQKSVKRAQKSNFGFWKFCAVAVGASAAVKIGQSIINSKSGKKTEDLGDLFEKTMKEDRPLDYKIMADEKITTIFKCRKKILELMDLYGCCTEAEILDAMGLEYDDADNLHKVFDSTTKFTIKRENGKYALYSQAPQEVFEDECPDEMEADNDEFGDSDEA